MRIHLAQGRSAQVRRFSEPLVPLHVVGNFNLNYLDFDFECLFTSVVEPMSI